MLQKNRIIILFLAVVMLLSTVGCGAMPQRADGTIRVVCTIFPVYDWAREIIGDADDIELILLVKNGADLHSYQPTADDIITISECDVFIYVGGESDAWVSEVLSRSDNEDMRVLNIMEILGDSVYEEEAAEGMQAVTHEADDGHVHEDGTEYDEHVWLSLRNAELVCRHIAELLKEVDSEYREIYDKNLEAYVSDLQDMDQAYTDTLASAEHDTVLCADRFPFLYLVRDYGIQYYAAFTGCSAETEASFETLQFLIEKLEETGLSVVLVPDGSDRTLAQTVIDGTRKKDQSIMMLDSMQSVTQQDIEEGVTYLSVMEANLEVLYTALGCGKDG